MTGMDAAAVAGVMVMTMTTDAESLSRVVDAIERELERPLSPRLAILYRGLTRQLRRAAAAPAATRPQNHRHAAPRRPRKRAPVRSPSPPRP